MLIFTLLLYLSMPICLRVYKMYRSEMIRCSRWYTMCELKWARFLPHSQDLLTRHKVLVAEYLEQNYDAVSDMFNILLPWEHLPFIRWTSWKECFLLLHPLPSWQNSWRNGWMRQTLALSFPFTRWIHWSACVPMNKTCWLMTHTLQWMSAFIPPLTH